MRPVICMVTDGGLRIGDRADSLVARVAAAAQSGVHLIQIRERALDDRTLLDVVRRCLEAVRGTATRLIVNDRLDVALAAESHGVHLTRDSLPAARVRSITPRGFLIGRSIHHPDEAASAAASVDYLLFGTVFETASKPGRTPTGTAPLAAAVGATTVPVLAIGGVTEDNAARVAAAGAAGIAAIGLFATADMSLTVQRVVQAFDLPIPGS